MAKLTPKQARFVEEYLIDLNGAAAAIRAGYSPITAKEIGSENLTKQDRVVRELVARIALVNPVDVINMDEATIKDLASADDTASVGQG